MVNFQDAWEENIGFLIELSHKHSINIDIFLALILHYVLPMKHLYTSFLSLTIYGLLVPQIILLAQVLASNPTPYSISNTETPQNKEVFEFLQKQEVIRVYIGRAPGFGNQSASLSVMRKLRELGFSGLFEVIFPRGVSGKLESLFPGLDFQKISFFSSKLNIKFIVESEFYKSKNSEIELGVSGADDTFINEKMYNVKYMLQLNPLNFSSNLHICSRFGYHCLIHLTSLSVITKIPNPKDVNSFIRANISFDSLPAKANGLISLNLQRNNMEFLPAYGLGFKDGYKKLAFLMNRISEARAKAPHLFKGPTVIGLISTFNSQETAEFQDLLQTKVKIVDIEDSNLLYKIQNTNSNDTLLIRIGLLSQQIFEFMFSMASLPTTVAGKNGINLAFRIGKPFLISNAHDGPDKYQSIEDGSVL